MLLRFIQPLRYFWKAVSAERTPKQIAWGIAIGMLVGLVPKGNLTACIFGFVMLGTRVNLGAGMLTALGVTALSPWLDPLTHGIGWRLLSISSVQAMLGRWYDTPFFPWLALNNTVVLGSTLLGLVLLYPVQHLSEMVIESLSPHLQRLMRRSSKSPDDELCGSEGSTRPDRDRGSDLQTSKAEI